MTQPVGAPTHILDKLLGIQCALSLRFTIALVLRASSIKPNRLPLIMKVKTESQFFINGGLSSVAIRHKIVKTRPNAPAGSPPAGLTKFRNKNDQVRGGFNGKATV